MHDQQLGAAMQSVLAAADRSKCSSIAVPPISSGIFGFPKQPCARVLLGVTVNYLRSHPHSSLREVRFTVIDDRTLEVFVTELSLLMSSEQPKSPTFQIPLATSPTSAPVSIAAAQGIHPVQAAALASIPSSALPQPFATSTITQPQLTKSTLKYCFIPVQSTEVFTTISCVHCSCQIGLQDVFCGWCGKRQAQT